jgi:Fe-S-cluster containining protein
MASVRVVIDRVKKLKVIPPMKCDEHCGECCGLVPVTETELRRVERYIREHGIVPAEHADGTCPLYQEGTCTVYSVRPLVCQLFGHSADPLMTCPRGYNVNLPERDVVRMLAANGKPTHVLHELLPQWKARALTEKALPR